MKHSAGIFAPTMSDAAGTLTGMAHIAPEHMMERVVG